VGAASGFGAVIVALHYFVRHRGLRLRIHHGRLDISLAGVVGRRQRLQ
jgi:hypothetical protein